MPLYEITNKRSNRVSVVSETEWKQIIDKGWKPRFTYKMVATPVSKPPFTPKEVIDMRKDGSEAKEYKPNNNKANEKQ